MPAGRAGRLALAAFLGCMAVAVRTDLASACHACVVGETCLPCPHADDPRYVILGLTATETDATWLVRVRTLPVRDAQVRRGTKIIGGAFLRGRIRCAGSDCVGRRGRVAGRLLPGPVFIASSTFPLRRVTCSFSGTLVIGDKENRYACEDATGTVVARGSARLTLCRGAGCTIEP